MKRPLGIWILLSAGVLWLSTQDVHGIRATSLILAKTSTATTTSTAATTLPEEIDSTEAIDGATNSTKPALTGIPQIDYIYDPNLPKELNGYNLSDYPFYERVPENITFKCDGLHDGFYASVPHKCQVYHHCLFGTRFDFLCANYTAFDQKTFICHFASEVDCNNSKKFWHRNDALYQAATTTTSKPLVIATTSPPPTVLSTAIPSGPGIGQWRGGGRPYRRRRPYYEYYEDYYDDFYYDDRPRSRGRKRPKPRPRPLYEDDYEDEYEDELYERRGGGGRRNENRRPYSRRPNGNRGRNKDRPRYNYDDEYDEYYEFEDNEDINSRRRKPTNKNKKSSSRKRPAENGNEDGDPKHQKSETQTVIKPISGTIYDRPRIAPKIKLPVPKNEANKYAYKPTTTTRVVHKIEDDYDSYEDNIKTNNKMEQNQKFPDNKPRGLNIKDDEKVSDDYYYYDYYDEDSTSKEKDTAQKESYLSTKKENEKHKNEDNTTSSTTTSTTTTTTTQTPLVNDESELEEPVIIRLVKRPFVPNRGGNQNAVKSSRPAGSRAITQFLESSTQLDVVTDTEYEKDFKPMITTKAPEKKHYVIENYMYEDNTDVRTHQPAKPTYKNSLHINVEDYDVTLNDALNPTLPNLPVRSYPTGFGVSNDYSYNNYQKSNKFSSEQTASTATTNYLLKTRPPRYENRQVSLEERVREPPVQTTANFRGFYSVVDGYRPKQSQNTYSYYTRYVYHHCLFGVRYDFLCANYTAFDQTLFNCNFVSNVDCENSKKFWNRNDELYKAKSTTPPPIVYTFYTQSPPVYTPQGSSIRRVPQRRIPVLVNPASVPVETPAQQIPTPVTQSDNVAVEVPSNLPPQPAVVEIPLEPRRRVRPPMRVRPYYDYYEDYDEPPRYIRKRPRPRPLYDDDDYEYYDDRFYRRNEGRRRRPYDRPIRRYKGRRDRYEDEEYDDYVDEEDSDRRKINRGSAMSGNTRYFTKRKPSRVSQTSGKTNRRPIVDEEYEDYDKKPANGSPRNRNPNRRPAYEYEDVDLEEINQKTNKKSGTSEITLDESKTIIKPNSGTIFDRPRIAPKINLPVPKHVAEKYSYKAMSSKPTIKEVDNSNEQENEGEQDSPIKSDQSSNEGLDVTTIKGSFKRTLISRRPSDGKVVRSTKKPSTSETEKVDEEIQESKTNTRQMANKTKNQPYKESVELSESSKKEVRRLEGQDRQRGTTKFNSIYKTRHSLSTPEAREFDNSNDFTDIDDSINEA